MKPIAVALVVAVAAPVTAAADVAHAGPLHDLAHAAQDRLDAAIAARPPPLVPPVAIALHWKPQKLGVLDLGGPLVALTAADLDRDGKAELYAVTPREVVVLAARDHGGIRDVGRALFTGEQVAPGSRDPIGAVEAIGDSVIAASSSYARGVRVQLRNGAVVGQAEAGGGFPSCGEHLARVPGRDVLAFAGAQLYVRACRNIVDGTGRTRRATAQLTTAGKLTVELAGEPPQRHDWTGVGTAFDIADLDRDGAPEIAMSAAGAPGEPDTIRVVAIGGDERRPLYRKSFATGIVGVVAGDLDGDGALEVIVAVRVAGAPTKIELWRLN